MGGSEIIIVAIIIIAVIIFWLDFVITVKKQLKQQTKLMEEFKEYISKEK
jgi:hypothetical protein